MSDAHGLFLWGFLVAFGLAMYAVVPRSRDDAGFFRGCDTEGRTPSGWMLTLSIFISWIFAKSVTNAANLGDRRRQVRRAARRQRVGSAAVHRGLPRPAGVAGAPGRRAVGRELSRAGDRRPGP